MTKKRKSPYMEKTRDIAQRRNKLLLWKHEVTRTEKQADLSNILQLQNYYLPFVLKKNKSLRSATGVLSPQPPQPKHMAYNTTA